MRLASWFGLSASSLVLSACSSGGGGYYDPDGGAGAGNTGGSAASGGGLNFGGTGGLSFGGTGGLGFGGTAGSAGAGGATGGAAGSGGSGGCFSAFDCDDANACTTDTCASGNCQHTTIDPNDFDACTVDSCHPVTGVTNTPVNINDNNACTTDSCHPINGVTHTPITCNDNDPCTTDSCNPATGCVYTPISGGGSVLFQDDFSTSSMGWTLGTEWAIGPAVAGTCGDPSTDTSPSADNRIAGVVLGGCMSVVTHGYYYLTSPVINAASATTVTLKFQRWLNSDYTPYVNNVIEAYNGSTWALVWQSGSSGSSATSWSLQTYDLTPHKNANLRVRFGHNVGNTGAIAYGSWNIDDVEITSGGSGSCP